MNNQQPMYNPYSYGAPTYQYTYPPSQSYAVQYPTTAVPQYTYPVTYVEPNPNIVVPQYTYPTTYVEPNPNMLVQQVPYPTAYVHYPKVSVKYKHHHKGYKRLSKFKW